MIPAIRAWRRFATLRMRLAVLLSVAVLPLGIIAIHQTGAVVNDARQLEQRDLLARTLQAATTESALLRRAFGAADALGAVASRNPATCSEAMADFVSVHRWAAFAGFIAADGVMRCSSTGFDIDFSGTEDWRDFIASPDARVAVRREGAGSGLSVVIVTEPVVDPDTGEVYGAVSISIPHSLTDTLLAWDIGEVDLALVDAGGTVLSASTGIDDTEAFTDLALVPRNLDLAGGGYAQPYERADGTTGTAVLVPLVADRIYVLGLWSEANAPVALPVLGTAAPIFPLLMWIAAIGVAVFAVERLVLRHLNELKRRMAEFSVEEPTDSFAMLDNPPAEIREIAESYNLMVDRILADRAELADSVEEKTLLLREVHHRVKNTLQLIASILNMQIRSATDEGQKGMLKRVQDRVMSLSAIHKALYSDMTVKAVRVDRLLGDVVQAGFNLGLTARTRVETEVRLDPVSLVPDQAVPLALLTNELVTNAMKYVGEPESAQGNGPARVEVRLGEETDGSLVLEVVNTMGRPVFDEMVGQGTGLGQRLIDAFVTQLGGACMADTTPASHRVTVRFTALEPEGEGGDEGGDGEARARFAPSGPSDAYLAALPGRISSPTRHATVG